MQIPISALSEYRYFSTDVFVVQQFSDKKTTIDMCQSPRTTDALILFVSGTAICHQEGEEPLFVPQGSLVYMPRGSRYTWELSPSSEEKRQERLLFEFNLYLTETKTGPLPKKALTPVFTTTPVSFSHRVVSLGNRHFLLYRSLFRSLLEKHSRFPSSPLELDHAISEIFYQLGEHSRNKISPSPDFLLIEKGISYLENDTRFEKSICQLAKESNVSVRYFEKLFKRYAGVSPKEYADARRIYWIKILLGQQGIPLKEIAHRLSFADSAYLCRFFKNKTGMTPSEYRSRYC